MKHVNKIRQVIMKGLEKSKQAHGGEEEKYGAHAKLKLVELSMDHMNELYENYLKKEEYLTGVLNTKSLSQKNIDFRTKLKSWVES